MNENQTTRLLKIIEDQLGWGNSETWTSRDFEELNVLIQEKTKVSLSSSTLRRLWGKADYKNQPSLTTLDTLAKFSGFENWRKYCLNEQQQVLPGSQPVQPIKIKRQWFIAALSVTLVAVVLIVVGMLRPVEPVTGSYTFNSHPITHDLPNTVVFTYNAQSAPTDSVFIQQSWDESRKVRVDIHKHLFNSIYYKPGFYHAKLTVSHTVVKEHSLLIPTTGWLGLIDQNPVPVYLNRKEFLTAEGIQFKAQEIGNHPISIEQRSPTVEFYNTGNFKPVPISNFLFSAEVKNDYKTGASRCQQIGVILYTNDIPISIPLSAPGCVASLNLLDGHREFRGSSTDLTGFGVDPSNWIQVTLISRNGKISVMINSKKAFEIIINKQSAEILGLGFIFQGSAGIKKITLSSGNQMIFNSFN